MIISLIIYWGSEITKHKGSEEKDGGVGQALIAILLLYFAACAIAACAIAACAIAPCAIAACAIAPCAISCYDTESQNAENVFKNLTNYTVFPAMIAIMLPAVQRELQFRQCSVSYSLGSAA